LRSGLRWATVLAGVLALWLSYSPNGTPYISNDGYQYLDAASSLASGPCFCTRVALFDEQVAFGRFPIPFTHFAPGYPLLMAAVSRTGMAAETAGYLLSALGFLAAVWLIQDLARSLGARGWVAALFSLIWITHATGLLYASSVGTETLFTAILLGLVALIVRDVRSDSAHTLRMLAIGAVAGLSYWIRYPGLFLAGGAGIYLIARAWRVPRTRRGALAGLLAAGLLAGSVQIRNTVDTGSWRGGFTKSGRHSAITVVIETFRSLFHLLTGDRVPLRLDIGMLILVLSAALMLFFVIRATMVKSARPVKPVPGQFAPMGWALFVGFAYIGGVMLAAMTTIAYDLPRYYFPVYPLLLACAAAAGSVVAEGRKSLVVILFVLSVITLEGRNLFVKPAQADWLLTRSMLAEEVQPGTSLLEWLRKQVRPDGTILAVEGQAVHYVLQRPVVAVIPAGDTVRQPDEAGFRSVMLQFRSRYLLLFPGAPPERIPDQTSYGFLQSVASGNAPAWLKLAARTRNAAVYECADCVN